MGNFTSSQTHNEWKSDAQHAMEAGTFCVICGGPFDLDGDVYNIDPKDPRYQWLYRFRLLGNTGDVDHMVVTSEATPNNLSGIRGVFLSDPSSFRAAGTGFFEVAGPAGQDDILFDTLSYSPDHGSLFPLHEACIDTSCRAIDHHLSRRNNEDRKPALEFLSRLLNTRLSQQNSSTLNGNDMVKDIFDQSSRSSLYGPRSVLGMTRLEWWAGEYDKFYCDPLEKTDAAIVVQSVLKSSPRSRDEPSYKFTTTQKPRALERLPAELLEEVCVNLPISSIIALHRTSKALAIQLPLDSTFWRNSLRDGSLHPHMWDLDTKWIERDLQEKNELHMDPTASWDWKGAAKLLAMKRFPIAGCDDRLADLPHGFWNRCRIWATIEEALYQEDCFSHRRLRSDSGTGVHEHENEDS
ncbi:hypothetical protein PtrSN002B_011443 [Pyrenophora tritici-repentis]|uniref:F-box domain-containing protein n=2 Tax=Pyrenophora tritici-repentis TaxID=45151 RepID=A0A2W1DIZ8_9PLEO|nr:hypothetical protein PtrV1_04042 [Pyrenophora tritici-repentis]KAF7451721.1 hypothetical protein A1F99_034980 [Pyrenophora tritici-repentis]KAF7575163.1 hypothetical protein PtrM4_067870 [Pyrenophora tritici-repentis]KAG9386079.1 hypothetical protein A1F94_002829 [Pyrenophora tritici-repentis]KAI0570204.1 hypothetical protein Alg130_11319 [Pyrenophora tritici-repentis]